MDFSHTIKKGKKWLFVWHGNVYYKILLMFKISEIWYDEIEQWAKKTIIRDLYVLAWEQVYNVVVTANKRISTSSLYGDKLSASKYLHFLYFLVGLVFEIVW